MISTVDSTVTAFVRGLGLPRRVDDATTELPPDATIAEHLEVLRRLGAGAKGVVYLARDTRLHRVVAVKLVVVDGEVAAVKAEREAQTMAQLAHPNVLAVHEVGRWLEFVYITMEHVDGGTLRRWQSLPDRHWRDIVSAYVQAARGLHAAHLAGLVHRDFKPDNVLIGSERADGHAIGRVRVGDFGLARSDGDAVEGIAGTPFYMAPEQVLERADGARADQFSFGVSLYEALCGGRPYAAPESWTATAADLRPPPKSLPQWLRAVVLRTVELAPAARYDDLGAVADALEHGLARAGRRRALGVLLGAVAVTAAIGVGVGSRLMPAEEEHACIDPSIENVWSAERSARIAEAFAATGSPIHARAHEGVAQWLDSWSERWRAQRSEACEALHAGQQSPMLFERRIACLDRRLAEMAAALDRLGGADRDIVVRALDLLAESPELQTCADTDRLLAAVAPPEDRALAEAVEGSRRQLDVARSSERLGRYPEAIATALAVRDDDVATRYLPLRAEASLVLGRSHLAATELADGERMLELALHDAMVAGDDVAVAEAAQLLVCADAQLDGAGERARRWLIVAEAAGARVDVDARERAHLRYCVALMHRGADEYAEALTVSEQALVEFDALPPDDVQRAILHDLRGVVLGDLSRNTEAVAAFRRAHELVVAARGPMYPFARVTRSHLGNALLDLGDPGAGLAFALEYLTSAIELNGGESAAVLTPYNDVATALGRLGEVPRAIAYLEQGVAIGRLHPARGRSLMELLANLGRYASVQNDDARALSIARETVELSTAVWGPLHVRTGAARTNLAAALVGNGRPDEILAEQLTALSIFDAALGPTSVESGFAHVNLAQGFGMEGLTGVDPDFHIERAERAAIVSGDARLAGAVHGLRAERLRNRGDYDGARAPQRRAVEIFADTDPGQQRAALFRLASDELILGNHAAALSAFEDSLELAKKAGNELRVAACEAAMARAVWGMGQRPRARELATRARERYQELGEQADVAETTRWLAHPTAAAPDDWR